MSEGKKAGTPYSHERVQSEAAAKQYDTNHEKEEAGRAYKAALAEVDQKKDAYSFAEAETREQNVDHLMDKLGDQLYVKKDKYPAGSIQAAVRQYGVDNPPLPAATAAKYSKVQVYKGVVMLFPRALQAVAMVSEYGAKKHEKPMGVNSFLDVPYADTVYLESEMRHLIEGILEGPINSEDGSMLHKAQKAWNALADLEVSLSPRPTERP